MPSTSQLAEAPEAPSPEPGFLSEIIGDASLTPGEKLLMIEALFVHDATGPSPPGDGAQEWAAARLGLAPRRRAHERLRTWLRWGALTAALAVILVGRGR